MRWPGPALLVLWLLCAGPACAQAAANAVERGRHLYQDGVLSSGAPLQASGAGNTHLSAADAACIQCHRRSGMGSREGSLAVSPIAGPLLFARPVPFWPARPGRNAQPITPLRRDARSAYDAQSLVRALQEGLDPDGHALEPLMPRYALAEEDRQALTAYLRQLSAQVPPGLQDGVLHLATILTADADPQRARLVSQTMRAWAASGALGGTPIALQVWQLQGPASTWMSQLQQWQSAQPVYAVLSGAGAAQWTPVHDFCESQQLPCLFPLVDFASAGPHDFYTLFFSRGVPLEAQLLAHHLKSLPSSAAHVVQLVGDAAGQAGADALARELDPGRSETLLWDPQTTPSRLRAWQPGDILVSWLRPAPTQELLSAWPAAAGNGPVYLSAQLAPPEQLHIPAPWRQQVRWISAHSDPARLYGKGVIGLLPWAEHLDIPLDALSSLSEIYAATYYFADALARMRGSWNPELLLETLESANFSRPAGAAYVSLSLAPGQREAAHAGELLGIDEGDGQTIVVLGARISP